MWWKDSQNNFEVVNTSVLEPPSEVQMIVV